MFKISKLALVLTISFLAFHLPLNAQKDKDIKAIKTALENQRTAWNNGDIESFMQAYWKSEKLQFIGSKGPVYGWQNTLERYKKSYPDRKAMGRLDFEIISMDKRSRKVVSMLGKFILHRESDELSGYFLLIWQKIKGRWVIVADHTS